MWAAHEDRQAWSTCFSTAASSGLSWVASLGLEIRGVKLIFTGGHISLAVAFKRLTVELFASS